MSRRACCVKRLRIRFTCPSYSPLARCPSWRIELRETFACCASATQTPWDLQLAVYFKRKYSRAARWEGAGTGTLGLLGLPPDLVLLAWFQNKLVLTIAAIYGHDMSDQMDRAAELLMIQGVHNSREVARRALVTAAQDVSRRLVWKYLRKDALVLVKQMFRVVGIKFTRKALLEKGIPLVAVPISAEVNEMSTRLLANQAIKFYDTTIK
jgi:hypothetical protein